MAREDILREIHAAEGEMEEIEKKLAEFRENYEILLECEKNNRESIERFDQSIQQRKGRIRSFSYLARIAKSAGSYIHMMEDELSGKSYKETLSQIRMIEQTLYEKKREVNQEICRLENSKRQIGMQIQQKWFDYRNFREES